MRLSGYSQGLQPSSSGRLRMACLLAGVARHAEFGSPVGPRTRLQPRGCCPGPYEGPDRRISLLDRGRAGVGFRQRCKQAGLPCGGPIIHTACGLVAAEPTERRWWVILTGDGVPPSLLSGTALPQLRPRSNAYQRPLISAGTGRLAAAGRPHPAEGDTRLIHAAGTRRLLRGVATRRGRNSAELDPKGARRSTRRREEAAPG